MAVSVRVNPLLESKVERTTKSRTVVKAQFIIDTVRHALGHQDSYALLLKSQAQERASPEYKRVQENFADEGCRGNPSGSDATRGYIRKTLRSKHGLDAP